MSKEQQQGDSGTEFWKRVTIIPDLSMDCPDSEFFAAWLDGRLSGVEQQRMEAHLSCCSHCFQAARLLRQVMESPAVNIPCSLELIHALVPSWKSGQEDSEVRPGWWAGILPAVHTAMITVFFLFIIAGSLYLGGRTALDQRQFHQVLMSELSFGLDDYHVLAPAG